MSVPATSDLNLQNLNEIASSTSGVMMVRINGRYDPRDKVLLLRGGNLPSLPEWSCKALSGACQQPLQTQAPRKNSQY
jgi:hypothetical protein